MKRVNEEIQSTTIPADVCKMYGSQTLNGFTVFLETISFQLYLCPQIFKFNRMNNEGEMSIP